MTIYYIAHLNLTKEEKAKRVGEVNTCIKSHAFMKNILVSYTLDKGMRILSFFLIFKSEAFL